MAVASSLSHLWRLLLAAQTKLQDNGLLSINEPPRAVIYYRTLQLRSSLLQKHYVLARPNFEFEYGRRNVNSEEYSKYEYSHTHYFN